MESSRPLAYESLKNILKHLSIDTRNKLRHNYPEIRTAESSAPLKIERLEFHNGEIVIDNRKYRFYKSICPMNENPASSKNRQDFDYDDIDEIGEMENFVDSMTPGDVLISTHRPNLARRIPDLFSHYIKYVFENLKTGYTNTKYLKNTRVRTCLKNIAVKMLGGRSSTIQVKNLVNGVHDGVISLPENLKLQVQNLSTNYAGFIEAFAPILDPDFPLESLNLGNVFTDSPWLQHNLTKKAKILKFGPLMRPHHEGLPPLSNYGIDLRAPWNVSNAEDVIGIVKRWMKSDRENGSFFKTTICRANHETVREVLKSELGAISKIIEMHEVNCPEHQTVECQSLQINELLSLIVYWIPLEDQFKGDLHIKVVDAV
ncbi:hypothetical protein CRE_12933 [Caenorhabditis remanei]|uniref:F-box associated domain-containing protein n=1 Tax=Caenorhabditis remanei TaxID=31234 RepID=E3N128_CAERE|nr:hypothetical protein CRE_12933 [Caenorhabditis remanei]